MTLNPGQPAPPISGVNVINDQPWSLQDHAGKVVLLAFSGITWCGPCQGEAPHLEAVWQDLQDHPTFTMAIISGRFDGDESSQALQSAINQFGITFPVVPGASYWDTYDIGAVPTLYCVMWNSQTNKHEIGHNHVGAMNKDGILSFLKACGITSSEASEKNRAAEWAAVLLTIFGGVGSDGGGWGVTPGGKPIPIPGWDPLRNLGPLGRDALVGLAVAEMAGRLEQPRLRERVRQVGLDAARTALERLAEARLQETPHVRRAWGPEDAKLAAQKGRG